jgi:flagellar basal body rod protein FlgC
VATDTAIPGPRPESTFLSQGYLEGANVNPVQAMTEMIETSSAFEAYQKVIQSADEATSTSINDVGKTIKKIKRRLMCEFNPANAEDEQEERMIRSLWSAATGMQAQTLNIDVISNNLANVGTSGFKKSRADFQDLLYQTLRSPGESLFGGHAGSHRHPGRSRHPTQCHPENIQPGRISRTRKINWTWPSKATGFSRSFSPMERRPTPAVVLSKLTAMAGSSRQTGLPLSRN